MFKFPKLSTQQIDGINIGLMLISLAVAFILPFELFLFSYAVLGPLHYLTEISWLHQRRYFVTKHKENDYLFFAAAAVVLGLMIFFSNYYNDFAGEKASSKLQHWGANIIIIIFALGFIYTVLKKNSHRFIALGFLVALNFAFNFESYCLDCTNPVTQKVATYCGTDQAAAMKFLRSNIADTNGDGIANFDDNCVQRSQFPRTTFFFTALLPTLVHVYVFTMLFMLFGALKSKSKLGLVSVGLLILCGIIPFIWDPSFIQYEITEPIQKRYDVAFLGLNKSVFESFHLGAPDSQNIYFSRIGIMLTRFIAFAYTYHYLNWFSKTSIIQWYKMPAINLVVVLLLWAGAVALYISDYATGLKWLFFLSFLHVFMEFPLNFTTIVGIGRSLFGKKAPAKPA